MKIHSATLHTETKDEHQSPEEHQRQHHSHEDLVVDRHHVSWEVRVNVSTETAGEGLYKPSKTGASELKRLSKGLEPNRRRVWPSDTPVVPGRIYINSDS